jgi:hypothetical protein
MDKKNKLIKEKNKDKMIKSNKTEYYTKSRVFSNSYNNDMNILLKKYILKSFKQTIN